MATGRRNDPEEELRFAHYDASAEQMRRLNGSFRRSLWWNLGNAIVLITITIITVGLISAGRADNISIPKHDTGSQLAAAVILQIIALFFCITVCILAVLAAAKNRICTIMLTFLYGAVTLYQLTVGMPVHNFLYTVCFLFGLLLNLRLLYCFRKMDELSKLPGYPLFERRLDESSDYELPIYLQNRPRSDDMEDVSAPAVSRILPGEADMLSAPTPPDMETLPRTTAIPAPKPEPVAPVRTHAVPELEPVAPVHAHTVPEPEPVAPMRAPAVPELEPVAPVRAHAIPEPEPMPRMQPTAPARDTLHDAPGSSASVTPDSLKLRTPDELFGTPIFTSDQIYAAPEDNTEED